MKIGIDLMTPCFSYLKMTECTRDNIHLLLPQSNQDWSIHRPQQQFLKVDAWSSWALHGLSILLVLQLSQLHSMRCTCKLRPVMDAHAVIVNLTLIMESVFTPSNDMLLNLNVSDIADQSNVYFTSFNLHTFP